MKKIALVAALALAMPAWAQEAKPPAEAPKAAAPAPTAKAEAPKPKTPREMHPERRQQDARHCLEKENSTEIIKCAEEYL